MKVTFAFLLVACLSAASINCAPRSGSKWLNSILSIFKHHGHDTTNTPDIAEAINDVLVSFKHIIRCGDESTGLPVLEPLRVPHISVDINKELLTASGNIDDMVLTGLGDFIVIDLITNSTSGHTTYDILFKDIQVLGEFSLIMSSEIMSYPFTLSMVGLTNLQLQEIRFSGGFTVGTNANGGVLLTDVTAYVQLGNVIAHISNYVNSVAANNYYRKMIEETLLIYVQTNQEFLNYQLSSHITESANTELYSVSSTELIQQMVNISSAWNATSVLCTV